MTKGIADYNVDTLEPLTEKEKEKDEYLHSRIDRLITQAYNERNRDIHRSYDLRHGIRDTTQFDHITKKYGVEFPAQLTHTPIIDRHAKVLEGEMSELPLNYRITCLDKPSLEKVADEKTNAKKTAFIGQVTKQVNQHIEDSNNGLPLQNDHLSDESLAKVNEQFGSTWRSSLEIEAQHVLNHEMYNLKFHNFSDRSFSDLDTCGEEYYVSKIVGKNQEHWFERIDPRNIFYVKPSNLEFINDCDSVVYTRKESISTVLSKWGDQLTQKDRDELLDGFNPSTNYVVISDSPIHADEHINDSFINTSDGNFGDNKYIDVYYTEWKAINKVGSKFRKDLYQGVRLGGKVYVDTGRYKHCVRNPDHPNDVKLNFNGVLFDENNSKARSMFIDTEDLQNRYDIFNFHMENAVALSGNKVQTVIMENIPIVFGDDITERLLQHQEYTKHGYNYVSIGQEGSKEFNNYGNAVDLSLGSGVKLIMEYLTMLEARASIITGVSPAQMGEMSPYAGPTQTKLVVNRSSLVVRKLFATHFKFCQAALASILNTCRITYKKGFKGAYLLGDKVEDFTMSGDIDSTFFGIHISSDVFEWKGVEDFKQMAIQLVTSNQIDAQDSIDIYTSKSLTEIHQKLTKSLTKKKADKTQELQQQVEQAAKKIQELEKQVQGFDQSTVQIEMEKIKFNREKLTKDMEIRQKELDELIQANADSKEIKLKQLELEQLQVTFSKQSAEVKNIQ